jgi:hypothetical protein
LYFGRRSEPDRWEIVFKRWNGTDPPETVLTDGPRPGLLSPQGWSDDGRELVFVYAIPGATGFNIGSVVLGSQDWKERLATNDNEDTIAMLPGMSQ